MRRIPLVQRIRGAIRGGIRPSPAPAGGSRRDAQALLERLARLRAAFPDDQELLGRVAPSAHVLELLHPPLEQVIPIEGGALR